MDIRIAAIAVLAIFVLVHLGWSSFREYQIRHECALLELSTAQEKEGTRETELSIVPWRAERPVCSPEVPEGSPLAALAMYDLRAQQDMAEWAYATMLATIAGVFVTSIGFVYVIRTFHLNAVATEHAARAAEAADRTLRNERAWMLVAGREVRRVLLTESIWKGDPFSGERLDLPIVNFGRTPALDVSLRADQKIVDRHDGAQPENFTWADRTTNYGVAEPSGRPCSAGIYLSNADMEALTRQERRAFLYIEVSYRDIFVKNEIHVSRYCFEFFADGKIFDPNYARELTLWSAGPIDRFTHVN